MRLPLLDFASTHFAQSNLNKVLVIACQHILETNLVMFEYLFEKGLSPKNTFILGKCYSTNREVLREFEEKGVFVHEGSTAFDSAVPFDEQFDLIVQNFLKEVQSKKDFSKYEHIVLIDDGGYLVYWANKLYGHVKHLVAVEQTSSGYTKLRNEEFHFPVVNVARSEAKLKCESPVIAEVVFAKLHKHLNKLKLKPKNALVVGAGALGKSIFDKLHEEGMHVKKFDTSANSDFKHDKLATILPEFDLIVGATGSEIIGLSTYSSLKKEAVLASASSSDREFAAVNLRKLVPKISDCHKNIFVRSIYLLNCGFPINFDGGRNSAAPEKIQLTRALMYSAVFFALATRHRKGIIDLDKRVQEVLMAEFKKKLQMT